VTTPIFRLYEALAIIVPTEGAQMHDAATSPSCPCLLCEKTSHHPPSRMGFVSAGNEPRLFQICADCGLDLDDVTLEQKIVAKITNAASAEASKTSEPIPVQELAAAPAIPAPDIYLPPTVTRAQAKMSARAAKEWLQSARSAPH
jgi:hypothetical protein